MLRSLPLAFAILTATGTAHAAGPGDTSGTWLTEDGRARIRLERCGTASDKLCGYVVWLKDPSTAEGTPKLDQYNPDASKRGRTALGIQLLKGLTLNGDGRFAGQIYNADNGKSYDVTVWSEAAGELSMRGCLVYPLCKTQTWTKAAGVAPGQLAGLTGAPNGPRPDAGFGKPLQVTGQAVAKSPRKTVPVSPSAGTEPSAQE